MSVGLFSGIIFTVVGIPFWGIGVWMAVNFDAIKGDIEGNGPPWMLPAAFIALGSIAAVLGIVLIILACKHKAHRKELIAAGNYLIGTVVDFEDDYSVQVNGRPGYRAIVQYIETGTDKERTFISDILFKHNPNLIIGARLRVYYDKRYGYSDYYVEIPK